jgi:hypothetical protein
MHAVNNHLRLKEPLGDDVWVLVEPPQRAVGEVVVSF